ncbi:hypothetical protein M9H77_06772 [Catharanthus roseus]|uniref:Uncharacterized protein n=1 Tax=Catharanthus roseus TaxID=4058 RepID=A0ACC0BTB2_CATRO|nr:hypothetical protein M9H77_06772 [Catharanthus roseus]
MNRMSRLSMEVKLGPMTRAQRKKLNLQEDNDMLAYMMEALRSKVDKSNQRNKLGKILAENWISMGSWHPTTDSKLQILNRAMSTDGHLPNQSQQEGTSEPSMRHVNETLRSVQQSIEGLSRQYQSVVRDVEELKKSKSSATIEQRVGDNLGGSLGGKGYHRLQEEYPSREAWHDDNFYEDYGDIPNVGQVYHGGYYSSQQGDKALDKIKWKVPSFKGQSDQ